ncbi:TetR/AcrR family transcriptional regulator [Antrihabitans spumae]|uniref:TetR/AcrR family transcriptional regulator n=1 Tax=Antrihabitans spumae TaxID=3373370 RepID=A0ABW7JRI9_9NOCA
MSIEVSIMGRRERRRLETYDEIVEVSRQLLREGHDLSLRAVATQMGMTSPALYRYIKSVDGLHKLVAHDIYSDVVAAMAKARDYYPPDDPAARLAASATMFRLWALAHRTEFQMAFANPFAATRSAGTNVFVSFPNVEGEDNANPFADYFAELFVELHSLGLISAPSAEDLDPALSSVIQKGATNSNSPFLASLGVEGVGMGWLFKLAWARLYGVLMIEVFGQIEEELIESGSVFNTLMRETFASLGLADGWERLVEVSRDTVARKDF